MTIKKEPEEEDGSGPQYPSGEESTPLVNIKSEPVWCIESEGSTMTPAVSGDPSVMPASHSLLKSVSEFMADGAAPASLPVTSSSPSLLGIGPVPTVPAGATVLPSGQVAEK